MVVPSEALNLLKMFSFLVGKPVVQLLQLGYEASFLLFCEQSVSIVLLSDFQSVLVRQRSYLVNKVILLLLEGVGLASLVVFVISGEAILLLGHLLGMLVSDGGKLGDKVLILLLELTVVVPLHLSHFVPIALLLSLKLVAVPLVQLFIFFCLLVQICCIRRVRFLLVLEPFFLPGHILLSKLLKLFISLQKLFMLPPFLLVELVDMDLVVVMSLLLLLLNLLHELVDLLLETFLELLLHVGVLFQLGRCLNNGSLKLLSSILVLMSNILVLSKIFLKIIEDLELLVQGNQRIKLMLELLLLLLE